MKTYRSFLSGVLSELEFALRSVDEGPLGSLVERILAANRLFLAGKGRSGLQMRGFAMRLMHLGLESYVVGDVTTPAIGEHDLLLIGSGSGRTASLLEYAKQAQGLGAPVALMTADPDSPIASHAPLVVAIPAPTPKAGSASRGRSAQPMGTLFEQALGLLCDVLILMLMDRMQVEPDEMFSRHANLE
jgi:6-phospho-3-hexuloisomerase